jgi:hypothetical protein
MGVVPLEPAQVAALIQTTLVPVIMISAVGLIALVMQNRYSVVLERTYRINLRRLELTEELHEVGRAVPPARIRWLEGQLEMQDALLDRWLRRGVYTRNSLIFAFLGVSLFGFTSLSLVFNVLFGLVGGYNALTVALFIGGIVAFLFCFLFALIDVYQGLQITRFDTRMAGRLMAELREAEPQEDGRPRTA